MAETWTVKRVLDWTVGYLGRKGDERPRLSAEWLLSSVTGLSRVELYTNFDQPLSPEELAKMHAGVERRGRGEPLQYVTGEMPFRHIILRCEEGVLIPRPETEVLVDAALEGIDAAIAAGQVWDDVERRVSAGDEGKREERTSRASELREALKSATSERQVDELLAELATLEAARASVPEGVRVLDLCTGTGCIALSLASERRGTHVVATDLSPQAVALAKRNRAALGLDDAVDLYECDLAAAVPDELAGSFYVLVSNPPYIPSSVVPTLPSEVASFEPRLALDGGPDGLDLFRRILDLAPQLLCAGGWLCVELFEENVYQAAELCRAQGGWSRVEVRQDLTHRPRVLVAVREG